MKRETQLSTVERPASLVDSVAKAIRDEIAAGRFAAGSRLPPQEKLTEALGVSRTVIREAISRLESDGVLSSRKGSGVYVSDTPGGNVFRVQRPRAGSNDLQHIFELRFGAEVAAAELAAQRRTAQDLERMRYAMKLMATHGDPAHRASAEGDVVFHRAIAVATQNPYFVDLVDLLARQLLETRQLAWENSARFGEGGEPAIREHAVLFAAIRARDPRAARAAAEVHLSESARRMRLDGLAVARPGARKGA